jgi:hypothetical protein
MTLTLLKPSGNRFLSCFQCPSYMGFPSPNYIHFISLPPKQTKNKTNSMALSLQVNYNDWVTATCGRNLVPTFVDRGVSPGQRGGSSTVVNLSFLDRICYFSFKKLFICSHKGRVDPVSLPPTIHNQSQYYVLMHETSIFMPQITSTCDMYVIVYMLRTSQI